MNESSNALSFDESRELLADVRDLTQGTAQADLYEFACLLTQVLELQDQENCDQDSWEFITKSLEEIRLVVSSDESSSELMQQLSAEAIDRWGEHLQTYDEMDAQAGMSQESEDWEQFEDESANADSDVIAPTAEEISSLLSQLGGVSGETPAVVDQHSAAMEPSQPQVVRHETPARSAPAHQDHAPAAVPSPISVDSLDPELREAFLDDASSCVSSMEESSLRLDSNPNDADALNQICRELHTLKGASASVGLSALADQLHGLEDSLREDHTANRAPDINSLLKNVDSIRSQIEGGGEESPVEQDPTPTEQTRQPTPSLAPAKKRQPATFDDGPADDESVRVKSSQLNRLMDMLAELVMLRNRRETEVSELQEVYHELIGSVSKMRLLSNDNQGQAAASSSLQLSEVANDVLEVAQHVRDCARPVAEGNTAVSQFIRQFRQELVELRRTPVSGLFRRLQRVVRDAAQAESKEVRLQLLGEDAGIERSLQQRLYEPLLHIVRNSVCHGVETAEQRVQAGKSPVGTITLEAKSGPDLFVIEIRDDGRGLDYDAIRRRGIDSGLLAADHAASREELAQLIFQPGFSTRQTANQVAGRGVGMDVVATTLQRMRGWLEVDSEPQQGTRIRLSFPLPSVIQHAMVFRSNGQLFALPMQSVQSAGEIDGTTMCLEFSDLFGGAQGANSNSSQGIVLACEAPTSQSGADGSSRVTILVDEIVGPEEVVVRPLPPLLRHHPFCSGATLSGMGQTVLFLDARRVVESQSQNLDRLGNKRTTPDVTKRSALNSGTPSVRPRVLVVDDSLSARKRVVRSLQRYPVDIVEASDGRAALEIFKNETFVAVFSDMEMPHVTSMELLAEINSSERDDVAPVVIISSRSEGEFTERAKELGANNYLIKPLADDALDQALVGIPVLRHLVNIPTNSIQTSGEKE